MNEAENRLDFQKLAHVSVREARALLDAGLFAGAFYLAGYAIECAPKACIAKRTKRYDFPKKDANKAYTHNLEDLLSLADLKDQLKDDSARNSALGANWTTIKDWRETYRYVLDVHDKQATDIYSAITHRKNGVLSGLMKFW